MTENKRTENTSAEIVSDNSEAVIPAEEKKRQRRKLHEVTALNDIKYRGPFSYRHFRIFAWITMAMAQAGFFLSIATEIETELVGQVSWLIRLLSASMTSRALTRCASKALLSMARSMAL